jgi:hypothetical protein
VVVSDHFARMVINNAAEENHTNFPVSLKIRLPEKWLIDMQLRLDVLRLKHTETEQQNTKQTICDVRAVGTRRTWRRFAEFVNPFASSRFPWSSDG